MVGPAQRHARRAPEHLCAAGRARPRSPARPARAPVHRARRAPPAAPRGCASRKPSSTSARAASSPSASSSSRCISSQRSRPRSSSRSRRSRYSTAAAASRGRPRLLDLVLAQRLFRVDDEQEAQQHAVRAQRDAQPRLRADPLVGGQPHRALRLFDAERERPLEPQSSELRRSRIDWSRAASGSSKCGLCTIQRICRSSIATSRRMSAASESTIVCSGPVAVTQSPELA